jgi:IS4 transposase
MALLTGHEERDQTFLEDYPFRRGSIYMFDKAYVKTKSLNHIDKEGAWFVVRLKARMAYEVIRDTPSWDTATEENDMRIMGDHIIQFTNRWARSGYPGELRLVRYYCTEKNELMMFLTNNFILPPLIIALLYRYRWEIETFFRWIKQHLRIESFFGTSANAVMIQIYIAVTVFCALSLAVDDLKFEGSLYDFSRLLSTSLTEKVWLRDLASQFNLDDEDTDKDVTKYGVVGTLF